MPPQEAPETNNLPNAESGILAQDQSNGVQWMPDTVLSTLPKHDIPPLGSASSLPFLHLISRLKTTKREGWRRFGFVHGESIADHMYRMSIITMLCPSSLASRLDIPRCTKMALVHDMAESLVGDITPVDGVSKSEKSRRETVTMDYLTQQLLGGVDGGAQGAMIKDVWQEYEDGKTEESKYVHDVDKIELLLQMVEYERSQAGKVDLGEFSWVAKKVILSEMQSLAKEILAEREQFWASLSLTPSNAPVGSADIVAAKINGLEEYYSRDK